ncbi:MAG: hypothetical protein JXR52_12970 [Bacteroidales bacterium]|nr:hypothetical protein [Bacteroidales bacterium]MBN2699731.1 hypothetical protein [Bacteroidales bacterium]
MQGRKFSLSLLLLILSIIPVGAQFNTYSPYTRFGLGDFSKNGTGQNQAMGGTGIAIHENNRLNYLNPAAFSALDSMSVYFDFGANVFLNHYQTIDNSNYWSNMNLHHVAFTSSVGKHFGISAGIVPYSSIGYNIRQEYNNYLTGDAIDYTFKGEGGIMNFFFGISAKMFNRISAGVGVKYLLGRLTRERYVVFPANSDYSSILSTERFNLKSPVYSFGLQYKEIIKDKFFFTLGGIYDLKANIGAEVDYSVSNQFYGVSGAYLSDTVYVDPDFPVELDTVNRDFILPEKIGFGLSFGIPDKLIITGDYYLQDWSNTLSGENYRLVNASSLHLGAEFTPDPEALRGYHKLMTYRLGGFYQNSYLEVEGYQLKDYGISFGVGLPVRSLRTSFNVAFTLGTRGTTDFNMVKENYGVITFNITLHDLWFYKRKFD